MLILFKYRALEMFQASYLNGIEVKCCEHARNSVLYICTDFKCNQNPYVCNECRSSQRHYGHDLKLKQLIPAVTQISDSIYRFKKPIEIMYNQICSEKQNDGFMKYQQQRQQHYQSIRKHIQSIKFQIEQEINNVIRIFQKQMEKQKQVMYIQLEKYYQSYRDKFDYLSRKIGPIASINNVYKYYNKSNLLLKLLAENDPSSSIKWFNQLKKVLKVGEVLVNDPGNQIQKIKNLSSATNQLMDKLPRVRSSQYQSHLPRILNSSAKEVLKLFVKFGEIKHHPSNLSTISRSYSMQSDPHLYRNHSQDGP